MIYGKSFNCRCEINVNGKVKGDDLRVQAKHTEMVLRHIYNRFRQNKKYYVRVVITTFVTNEKEFK